MRTNDSGVFQHIPDSDIERFIEEDVPYGDLTTHLLGIGMKEARIVFSTREETTLCGTEEAGRVARNFGAFVTWIMPTGTLAPAGTAFLKAQGTVEALHAAWKISLNLLEYSSGIASRTARVVKAARDANPAVTVATTRKSFPGTKKIVIKAIRAGGAIPHRLGLSETILVFKHHTVFMGGLDKFLKGIPGLRARAPETKIIVEAQTAREALQIARAGVDVVQVDKLNPDQLTRLVKEIRSVNPAVKISAAGGINESNAAQYAATGVDIIVLSSVYFGKPADIGVQILPV